VFSIVVQGVGLPSAIPHLLFFFFSNIFGMVPNIYLDVFDGIDPNLDSQVEFGAFQKLRDQITKKQIIYDS
jgi:photosystem II CP47 chlorophyll apoprotein